MSVTDRPFRDLCSEADFRDSLSDEDFWQHVFAPWTGGLEARDYDPDDDWNAPPPDPEDLVRQPCAVCGERGPCGYDAEGRVLVHWEPPDDGEDRAPWEAS